MSVTTVPEKIFAGPTVYDHFAQGKKDLYAPDFLMPGPPLTHTWRYGVAADHGNTVFFHNEASKRSVWVLPVVDPVDGTTRPLADGETMRAEGHTRSAKAPPQSQHAASVRSATVSSSSSRSPSPAHNSDGERTSARHRTDEAANRALATAKGDENDVSASPMQQQQQRQLSVQERLAAFRARKENRERGESASGSSQTVQGGETIPTVPVAVEASTAAGDKERKVEDASPGEAAADGDAGRGQDADAAAALADFVKHLYAKRMKDADMAAAAVQREKLAALEEQRLAYERQRRRRAEEEAEEEERCRLLRARRAAEEQRLAMAQSALPTPNEALGSSARSPSAAVDAVNAFLQQQEATLDKARGEERMAQSLEEAIAAALVTTAPARAGTSSNSDPHTTEKRGEISVLQVRRDSQPPQQQQQQPERPHQKGEVRYGSRFRYLGDITTSGGGGTLDAAAAAAPPAIREAHRGHPSIGPFLRDSTNGKDRGLSTLLSTIKEAQELPVRDGSGTLQQQQQQQQQRVVTVAQEEDQPARGNSFFKGTWANDQRSGKGVLSLPHTVLEGEWREDAIVPGSTALLQTQRIKGALATATTTPAARKTVSFEGPAMLQLANGARVAGSVTTSERQEAAPKLGGGPCAIHLPSRDRVEWCAEDEQPLPSPSAHRSRRGLLVKHPRDAAPPSPRTRARSQAHGTGKCRIHFHNGDVYVGSVANFQLHGYGRYQFRETGNTYVGFFFQGFMQGEGVYYFADGDVYVGEFLRGAFHGIGCYIHRNAYLYEGEWCAGQMHGKGILSFANGTTWKGQFDRDKRVAGKYVHFNV